MNNPILYCGIDIAAESFDICMQKEAGNFSHQKLTNNTAGYKQLLKLCGSSYHFVMETTGAFHMPLCFFLHENKCQYSVVNALQVYRYIQMNLERSKSDKKDAKHICMYGIERKPEQYQMPESEYFACKMLNNSIETLTQEITSFTNKIYALEKLKIESAVVIKSYKSIIKNLQVELKKLEVELNKKLRAWQPDLVAQVQSVKGIGKRATAILLPFG